MKSKIIISLDGIDEKKALELSSSLSGLVWGFKVNDLLIQYGTSIIKSLKKFGSVFADAKLHDIPNTVANSTKAIVSAGADFLTVHACGGERMIQAAVNNAQSAKVLVVTVLTSLNDNDSLNIYGHGANDTVLKFAKIASSAGAHGIICSPLELKVLSKDATLSKLLKVTPGIRPSWYEQKDDQSRTMTPEEAIKNGADYLVIGRAITDSSDPITALKSLQK